MGTSKVDLMVEEVDVMKTIFGQPKPRDDIGRPGTGIAVRHPAPPGRRRG